jgi:membrane fusion protein (multidrug efflux system)
VKKKNTPLWITVIVIALALLAVPKLVQKKELEPVTQKTGKGKMNQTVAVPAIIVRQQPFDQSITIPGSVLANEQVQLKAEATGRIVSLALREGASVKKGALLVKINDADLQAQLEKAHAALKLAQDREKRQKSLADKNLISQEEYDLSVKELTVGTADVDLYKALIEKTEIRAPFDGRVGLRLVSEGAFLSIGAPVADFVKTSPVKVEFSVPERYASAIQTGTPLTFTIQGSSRVHTAAVYARQPGIDEATRTLRVRALCTEEAGDLLPGAFAEVKLPIKRETNALMVPTPAIVPDAQGQNVFLIKNNKAVKRQVRTGDRTSAFVEITSGLSAGDTVITGGVLMVRPGAPVKITKFETPNPKHNTTPGETAAHATP